MKISQELADFEEMTNGPQLQAADLIRDGNLDGLSQNQIFYSFVAEIDEGNQTELIGYTISYFSYSTWQGKSYFLEDLYVKPGYRKFGVGKKLFTENTKFALDQNCPRFDFHVNFTKILNFSSQDRSSPQVLNWNPAKNFYERLGATNLSKKEGWEFFRLNQSEMERLVQNQH